MVDARLRQLQQIYQEIAAWAQDREAVPRNIAAVQPVTALAVVGEAVGPSTVRLSGVNYFDQSGRLGPTGTNLDQILIPFGYTVYPQRNVKVANGTIEWARGGGRNTAYCTDLCPVFPGYDSIKRDEIRIRRPSPDLIQSALEKRFLCRELQIVNPKVILLLGEHAYKSFYRYFLNTSVRDKLSTLVYHMRDADFRTFGSALVVPLLHPSPASPSFARWFRSFPNSAWSTSFVDRVKSYLNS